VGGITPETVERALKPAIENALTHS
jgi:hypothetical protein